jgi:transcriptional regulator with XRE-family HTH domain
MKDRIQRIIDEENMTPSRFADEVGLNRPAVSHILNGRNNPGLDALQRIITRFPNINANWLITGKGNMYDKSDFNGVKIQSLFDENPLNPDNMQEKVENPRENALKPAQSQVNNRENQILVTDFKSLIKVKKIAVFYTDNTYEEFVPLGKV